MSDPTTVERLSLRKSDRGYILGGSGTGKSVLEEALFVDFYHRYLNSRILILDTKPRFRAEYEADGWSAKKRYRHWDHGPVVPGSVLVTDADDFQGVWQTGARIAIAQRIRTPDGRRDIVPLISCAQQFYDMARSSRPQLLVVDEGHDFFNVNASQRGGSDIIAETFRGGRELGLSGLLCSQRAKGIPAQVMEEMTRLYLFRVDYVADVKRTLEMGAPPSIVAQMPKKDYVFVYWTKRSYEKLYGPYRLSLPTRLRKSNVGG